MIDLPAPRRDDIEAVAWFLPFFERAGAEFGAWRDDLDGSPIVQYGPDAVDFVRLLEERGWVEAGWRPGVTAAALRYWREPALVASADGPTLRALLSDIVRTERVCTGHLLEAFERGYLVAILRRLKELIGAAAAGDCEEEG
ncbi:MAG: DUF6508 domain-containing protein [bacterium]